MRRVEHNKRYDKQCPKQVLQCVGIFLIYFFLQLIFLNDGYFQTDEQDVMQGGKAIARGFLLYKDFLSQHMPVSYYISAFFELLGAHSILMQRLYFYLFYALMWTVIYKRYNRVVRKEVLFLYPICFICMVGTYMFGTTILSEHLAGIGFVILVLEYLKFLSEREICISNCIMISLSVLLTFGTIFVGAFGVFVIAVGVLAQEIVWWKQNRKKTKGFVIYLIKKYYKLALIVAAPWVAYLIYLKLTRTLYLFYYSAYEVNRTIYPRYGGYGSSIFGTILGMVAGIAQVFTSLLFPTEGWSADGLAQLLVFILALVAIIRQFERKEILKGVTLILFVIALGTRGYFTYHGTQCVAIMCLLAVDVLVSDFIDNKSRFMGHGQEYRFLVYAVILLLAVPYIRNIGKFATLTLKESTDKEAKILSLITESDEPVWSGTTQNCMLMQADRAGLYNILGVPWGLEAHGVRVLTEFGDTPPRVIAGLDRNYEVWGFELTGYGKEVLEYIDVRYTCYNDTTIYIRNDYYEEATEILEEAGL